MNIDNKTWCKTDTSMEDNYIRYIIVGTIEYRAQHYYSNWKL